MIVEHTFVTTLDEDSAFDQAHQLLSLFSFTPHSVPAPGAGEWRRGNHGGSVRRQSDLPHRLRMDFDRGRVAIAADVEFTSHEFKLPKLLTIGLTLALERHLALAEPIEKAAAEAIAIDRKIRFRDRLRTTAIVSFLLFVVGVLIAGVVAAMRH